MASFNLKRFKNEWGTSLLFGIVIFVVAITLRTYNVLSIPIFADEAIYVRWAQVMQSESTLRFLPLSDGKQPLFMWSVIPFLKVFSDPLIAGRTVSIITGLASLIGIFTLAQILFKNKRVSIIASLLYAVSPFSVFFDRMALVDSMLTMFGIWALVFGILTSKTLRLDFAMLTGFALGGAWLTKSPAIFFLLMLPVTALLSEWSFKRKDRVIYTAKLFSLWLVSWFIAFVAYNVQRLGPNFHMLSLRNKDYVFPLSHIWENPIDPLKFHIVEVAQWLWVLLPGTVLVAAVFGIIFGWKNYRRELLLLAIWSLFPLFIQSVYAKVFTARYILFAIPPIILLGALPAAYALNKIKTFRFWILLAIVIAPSFWINYLVLTDAENAPLPRVMRSGYLEEWTAGTGIREIAEFIKNEHLKDPEQGIVVGTEGFFGTLPDGLQIYISDLPDVTVIGVGISISSVHESLIEAKKAGNKVYLVVNASRFEGKPEDIGLVTINEYPKASRKYGTKEYVVKGPRDSLHLFEVTESAIDIFEIKKKPDA